MLSVSGIPNLAKGCWFESAGNNLHGVLIELLVIRVNPDNIVRYFQTLHTNL